MPTMRRSIKFLLGNEPRELTAVDPTATVLDYLRLEERRCGTKEGCAEGDCGACTVVVGSLEANDKGGDIQYRAVNACIQFLHSLDGKQLITVEDLRQANGSLHPVQQAMVQEHGSQCGFCTPGFVMSLFALYQQGDTPDQNEIEDSLAGNLCRCTGYGPIVAAAKSMHSIAGDADAFADEAAAALKTLQDDATIHIEGPDGRTLYAPATTNALAALLIDHPDATVVAGATDVGLWVTKRMQTPDPVISLGRASELAAITETDTDITIGAMATYEDALPVLAGLSASLGEVVRRIGSTQIRNAGTIGGNIANGSPIGDMPPPLIALSATLSLRHGEERRAMALEDFFIDYGKQDLKPGEFVEGVMVPRPTDDVFFRCYKVSKRFDQDISAVLGAIAITIKDGTVTDARIAYGGMAAIPKRAASAEAALIGQTWSEAGIKTAMGTLPDDFSPIDDMRASADYRMKVARNLLMRAWLDYENDEDLSIPAKRRLGRRVDRA